MLEILWQDNIDIVDDIENGDAIDFNHSLSEIKWDKTEIFGEYADKIWEISEESRKQWMKLKEKLGNQFDQYVWKFVSGLNKLYDAYFKKPDLANYLLSPWCKVTLSNIDEYMNILNKYNWVAVNIGEYTPTEAEEIISYVVSNQLMGLSIYDKDTLDKVRLFKANWITKDMINFIKTGTNWRTLELYHAHFVEEILINEKEWKNLFNFLCKYPQTLHLWWQEVDKIELNTNKRNFCFRWILEMIKSRWDIEVLPYPWENADSWEIKEWKKSREKIIKEYENYLKYYIWLDYENQNGEKVQINRKNTFDKIFYSMAVWDEDPDWAFKWWFSKEQLQAFSQNKILDYSSTIDENWRIDQTKQKKLIDDLWKYAQKNPNEKILVYIWAHWGENWESWNWWTKDDWKKISSYPNVKIMSTRCYFWRVYTNEDKESWDYIYNQQSQLSWFSNKTRSRKESNEILLEWFNKWLWFHELEIYARLHYGIISPLTERFDYQDRITWEKKTRNIWLAYGEEWDISENIV